MLYYRHKCSHSPKSVVVAWLEKEHKSPVDKGLLRLMVLVSLDHNDTGQSCLGKILSTKLSFSLYLATYLHLPVQTQPAFSLWPWLRALGGGQTCPWIAKNLCPRDLDKPFRSQKWSSWRWPCCWWQHEHVFANMKARCKRSSEEEQDSWHPAGRAHKLDFVLLASARYICELGAWVFHHFPSIYSFQSQKNHSRPCWKKPLFLWKPKYPCRTLVLAQGWPQSYTQTIQFV